MKKTLSKVLAVIIAVMLIVSAMPVAFAADGDIANGTAGEGITWVIDADGTLTISGEGAIEVGWYSPPWKEYNNSIFNIVVEEGITEIPSTAFCYAENLLTVSIPASVTNMSIGTVPIFWANCALQAINVHEDNPVFTSVDGIVFSKDKSILCIYPMNKEGESYTIPHSVTYINEGAFCFNETLKSVTIPDTVNELGSQAFYDTKIESVTIGSGIKTIPTHCFSYGNDLESIVLPDSIETIETNAFWTCGGLKNIKIGTGIKTIYENAFGNCYALSAIHYAGTEEQWSEVVIEEDEGDYLSNIAIHYSTDVRFKEATVADCITDGHTAGDYCDACGDFVTGEVTEEAWGHDYVDGVCQRENCGFVCTHINDEFDDKCDDCGAKLELEFSEIKVGETKTAYIEEADKDIYVKFVPQVTSKYKLFSDNGGDHQNVDPYAFVYDRNFDEIAYNDDVSGAEEDYNFSLEFNAVKGKTYYIVLSDYNDDAEYSYTLEAIVSISHQPTAGEPYVELDWDVTGRYLWYELELSEEITDQNAENVVYDWGESSYDAQSGWSGVPYEEYSNEYDFFTVSLEAGETITVELIGKYGEGVGLWDYTAENGIWLDSTGEKIYEMTVEEAGDYTFYTYTNTGELTVRAYRGTANNKVVEGQYTNKLENPVIGKKYICVVTLEGGTELVSNVLSYTYAISHQPTEKEPYVEVNEDANVKYQWYETAEELDEITDEDTSFGDVPPDVEVPTYDAQDGWTGITMGEDTMLFFIVPLEAGETIKFVANEHAQAVVLFMPTGTGKGEEAYFDKNGEAVITVSEDGEYYAIVLGAADTRLKAYKQQFTYTKIGGETTAKLKNTIVGKNYACEVTFADGTTELSDVISKRYGDAHFGQWYSNAVEYVSESGIMTGYSSGKFGTSDSIQRQDFIVMLARYAGADLTEYDYDCELSDVASNGYYKAAINWAIDVGVTTGYDNGKFGVGDKMTREQLVTFLYRYAALIEVDTTVEEDEAAQIAAQYTDFNKVSSFSKDAIVWALANGVISGQGGVKVDPQGGAQRCQVAQIMYNIYINDIF